MLAIAVAAGLAASGCSASGSTSASSSPATTPAASLSVATAASCQTSQLPGGYVADSRHTGKLTADNYSQSADVQAALQYDQLQSGARRVFIHRHGGAVDGVVSCIAMKFATPHLANRFFLSYQALRREAGTLVRKVSLGAQIGGLPNAIGYREREQSFRGYHIASTTVLEAAGQNGDSLYIASVAGRQPSAPLAHRLLNSLVGAA